MVLFDLPFSPPAQTLGVETAGALERAAGAIARLDQALRNHPLETAFLYRARLEAVRRQAGIDGFPIDPWHLAAVLEGLRLRMDHALRIIDRGVIFAAARHALSLHQWLTAPDFDQEAEIRRAQAAFDPSAAHTAPLLAGAVAMHGWLNRGGGRAAGRAALVRHLARTKLLRAPIPLTGPKALRADTPWTLTAWIPLFLDALADEAADDLQLLFTMERAWFAARRAVAGRRRHSRASAAIDILAASPLVSATSLGKSLGMAVKNAAALLDGFCAAEITVEVTHRSKRRLFGLAGLAPLRDEVAPPRRPEPGRGRGRPPILVADAPPPAAPLPERPITPIERKAIDYSDLEAWMAHADRVIRDTRRALDTLARGDIVPASAASRCPGTP